MSLYYPTMHQTAPLSFAKTAGRRLCKAKGLATTSANLSLAKTLSVGQVVDPSALILSFAKTPSGGYGVDLSARVRPNLPLDDPPRAPPASPVPVLLRRPPVVRQNLSRQISCGRLDLN